MAAAPDNESLRSILVRSQALVDELRADLERRATTDPDGDRLRFALDRLTHSVVRPLISLNDTAAADGDDAAVRKIERSELLGPVLWRLALDLTKASCAVGAGAAVWEATATLQDLACRFAVGDGDDGPSSRLRALRAVQADAPAGIQASLNGPYLVTNVDSLVNWLGEAIEVRPRMALCRCGASRLKPWCDGSHASNGFSSAKDPKRVPDRLDRYEGVQLTVLDNRGTCAHSGFCTDRVPTVFRQGQEPFVTASGARMDDIERAIRACPSGALSCEVDGHDTRALVDTDRAPSIEVSKDGPYRVTGALAITDEEGKPAVQNLGASHEHYSLCRCGQSQNKPFCSGMHWYVRFHDPVEDPERAPTLFEWAGGLPALIRLTRVFYSKYVPEDPLVGPLFANMRADHPERVASWLGEVFGGPKNYSDRYGGYVRMISQHLGKALTEAQRARWVALLCKSADDVGLPADPEFRAAFVAYLEWGSRLALENSQPGSKPPPHMPMPRWWWVCDATPGSRVSALPTPESDASPPPLPKPDEVVTFSQHIKPLFRRVDRQSMSFAFDLWQYDDVVKHAESILHRLEQGTMPCDGAWPPERIQVFRRWLDGGTAK
jgi:CDGSH-type Zn-finger protein/truncated hemoglobin YjbI/ferredoxin